jgi:hypothetical protein
MHNDLAANIGNILQAFICKLHLCFHYKQFHCTTAEARQRVENEPWKFTSNFMY